MNTLHYSGELDITPIYQACLNGKAINTQTSYRSGFNQWKVFAKDNMLTVFPVNEVEFTLFLIDWLERGGSWSSLNNSICAVKFYMDLFDFSFSLPKNAHIEQFLRKNSRKVNNKKRPLFKHEVDLIYEVHKSNVNLKVYRNLCILFFGFYGFMRYSDFTQIRLVDVKLNDRMISIVLYDAKNDVFKQGQQVMIKCDQNWIVTYKTYLKLAGFERLMFNDSIFLFPAIKNDVLCAKTKMSYAEARKAILDLCKKSGIDTEKLGTHSLRIGGVTEASKRGVPDHIIDSHGRWVLNSRARSGYQRVDENDFAWLSDILMN